MYCANCGKELAAESKFCPECGAKVVKEEVKEVEAEAETNELESKNVSELRAMAKEAGIKGYSTMKKDELISSLK